VFSCQGQHSPPARAAVTSDSTCDRSIHHITEHEAKIEDQNLQQPQVRQCMRLLALDGGGQLIYFLLAGVAAPSSKKAKAVTEYLDIAL
jgi:hypothetical protein